MTTTLYRDHVVYTEVVREVAWRSGSVEVNEAVSRVEGRRVFSGGRWIIYSSQNSDLKSVSKATVKLASRLKGAYGGLAEAELYSGEVKLGREALVDKLIDVVEEASRIIGEGEVIATSICSSRVIDRGDSSCREDKCIVEVLVYAEKRIGASRSVASSSIAFTNLGWSMVDKMIESAARDAVERAEAQLKAKPLNPLEYGRWSVILDYDVAAAFFHELAHMLEGDQPNKIPLGSRLTVEKISVIEDPRYPWSPAMRFFDDEGVRCYRKTLVDNGVVVSHTHTRLSAWLENKSFKNASATPGQASGLFHHPKAMHSTIVVGGGDWRYSEIIEESKRAILAKGVVKAELYSGVVRITPENAWLVENGEVKKPVYIGVIKIPVDKGLACIEALTYNTRMRHSYEKNHVVAEVSPAIKTIGYVAI